MNSRRTVIIAAALILAALAFFGNVYYLNGAQQRAYHNAKLVDVYVVKKAIPKGLDGASAISQDYIQLGVIPQQYRPGSAIAKGNINDIKSKVAINALSPGQIVVDGQFVDASVAQVTFAQRVPPGQVAITVSVDQVHGVAGLLMPGDKVDVFVLGKQSGGNGAPTGQIMYQNVNILAIGTNAAPQAGDTNTTKAQSTAADNGLITFAVPLDAADRIALVTSGGGTDSIYLALVPPDNQPETNLPNYTGDNVLNNLPPTPYPNQ